MPNYTLALSGRYGSDKLVERMKLVFSKNTVNHKLPALFACAMAVFLLASYAFVIQPYSEPPLEDIEGCYKFTPGTAFVLYENGSYNLYVNGIIITELDPGELDVSPFDELEIKEEG